MRVSFHISKRRRKLQTSLVSWYAKQASTRKSASRRRTKQISKWIKIIGTSFVAAIVPAVCRGGEINRADRKGRGKTEGKVRKSEAETVDCRRGILSRSGFTAPRAACTEMQISPACPLAFYRINLRPIRRTTIFNGSSHNSLLCSVKGQSLEGLAKMRAGQKWHCLTALFFSGFFDKMAHCCVSIFLPPRSTFSLSLSLLTRFPRDVDAIISRELSFI